MSTDRRFDPADSRTGEASPSAAGRIRNLPPEDELPIFVTNTGDEATPVGRFHYATLLHSRPQILTAWRVSSGDPSVLHRVAELLGVHAGNPGARPFGEVVTDATTVDVILSDPSAIDLRWYLSNERTCDQRGECRCPPALSDRRRAARAGRGCEPRVQICFRLYQDTDLGAFSLVSGSWSLVEDATTARRTLGTTNGPVVAQLALEKCLFTLRGHGRVAYTRPRLIAGRRASTPTIRERRADHP